MRRRTFRFGFRSNVFALCIGLTALITISISLISFNSAKNTIEKNTESLINGNVEEATKRFNMFVDAINRVTLTVSFEFANKIVQNEDLTTYQQQNDFKQTITQYSALSSLSKYILKMDIFNFKSNEIMTLNGIRKVDPTKDAEYKKMAGLFTGNKSRLDFIILENRRVATDNITQNVITFVFPITDNNNNIFGCVATYVSFDDFNGFCSDIAKNTNGYVVLVDGSGKAISASDGSLYNNSFDYLHLDKDSDSGKILISGIEMIYSYNKTNWNDTSFICIVPYQTIMQENTRALGENILISSIFVMVLALLLTSLINMLLFKPIRLMLKQLQKDSSVVPKSGLKDEVGYMLDTLTEKMAQNQELMRNSYVQEIHLKDARIRLLVSQMNPHFLYNSLDTILWLLEFKQYSKIKAMIHSLAKFYRANTDKGGEYIAVRQEKSQIENFLYIQKIRFSDRLSVIINFQEDILDDLMIKFLLQPLVENAIRHGIEKKDGIGNIIITAERDGKDLVFRVADDGVGIPQEKLEQLVGIIEEPEPDSRAFYALHNVNWRIKLKYGESYGLSIKSSVGSGTCVTIRVPATKEENGGNQIENAG